jgi:hypothetical protein
MSDYPFWKKQGIKGSDYKLLTDAVKGIEEELGRPLDPDESHLVNGKIKEFGIELGPPGAVREFEKAATERGIDLKTAASFRRSREHDSE